MNRNLSKVLLALCVLGLASLSCSAASSLLNSSGAVLQDDFSDSSSGWGTLTDANSSVEYADSGLQMKVFKENYFIWSTPNKESYDKVHIEVAVKNNDTDPTTAFGIMCYQQAVNSSFYYLAITPAGEYAIAKASVGASDVFLTNNDKWATADTITKNVPSYLLGADCGNGTLTLYVDGKLVASVSDTTYTTGNVGLFTWSGEKASSADVTFDNFAITKLGQ
jgi:hypothetical protein